LKKRAASADHSTISDTKHFEIMVGRAQTALLNEDSMVVMAQQKAHRGALFVGV
jgi:hypothetical protein